MGKQRAMARMLRDGKPITKDEARELADKTLSADDRKAARGITLDAGTFGKTSGEDVLVEAIMQNALGKPSKHKSSGGSLYGHPRDATAAEIAKRRE